jgi:hypothetical protein
VDAGWRGLCIFSALDPAPLRPSVRPEECIQFAIALALKYTGPVKTVTMTLRGCPEPVHEALKKSAKANRRSLNKD